MRSAVSALLALAAILAGAQPARAESVAVAASLAAWPDDAAPAPVAEEEPPVTIRTGRALDLEGRPVYTDRSSFSGTAAVARFSLTRPRIARQAALANIPLAGSLPLARGMLTSGFGTRSHPILGGRRMHSGVDLAAPAGAPVIASSDGVVGQAGWRGGYGLLVTVAHGSGVETRYAHMSRLNVIAGQSVRKGDVIGFVGSTGRSTGPHLHYEMRVNGRAVNPMGIR